MRLLRYDIRALRELLHFQRCQFLPVGMYVGRRHQPVPQLLRDFLRRRHRAGIAEPLPALLSVRLSFDFHVCKRLGLGPPQQEKSATVAAGCQLSHSVWCGRWCQPSHNITIASVSSSQ